MGYRFSLDLTTESEREAELHTGDDLARVTIAGRVVEVSGIKATIFLTGAHPALK